MLSSIATRVKTTRISNAELFLFFVLFTFGISMVLLIPPGAGYDEEDHLVRVWELSAFSFIPGQLSPRELNYPTLFRDLAYRQQAVAGIVGADFWQEYSGLSLYERGSIHRELNTKSVYSPALLLPQAILMRLGRQLDLPALSVFYLCRFASLFSYLVLVWLAIRLIPFGEWILLVLAASPMALFQASTISPDAISNGIGFLFIAGCLKLAELKEIDWQRLAILVVLVSLLFLAKLNLLPLILLLFLLISPSQFIRRGMYVLLLVLTILLFIVEAAGWNLLTSTRLDPLLANEANPSAQVLYILSHPVLFIQTLIQDILSNGWVYIQGWINGYGYYYWTPPQIVSVLFLLSLGAAILLASRSYHLSRKLRIVFMLVFAASYLATILSLYATFTPVGSDRIFGVQGRYFIPLALLLFLAISGVAWPQKFILPRAKWIMSFLAIALSLNVLGLLLSFYVPCGPTFYQTGLCYQPLYRDLASATRLSQPVSGKTSVVQEVHPACNGLAEVRILVSPSVLGDKGLTQFLFQDSWNHQTLADSSVPNDQIREETWYPLRFNPDWNSADKRYTLKILSTDAPVGQGLQLLYSLQPEVNLGNLYENGASTQGNMVLQYGCITGLRKIWLTGQP